MAYPLINIRLYESQHLTDPPMTTLAAGVHTFRIQTNGNSILSTIYVYSLSGTVKAKWYDFGPSDGSLGPGERVDLNEHILISTPDTSDRITILKVHNKAHCEITVTGGPAVVGVYATVVSTFASELDSHLKLDGQTANLVSDKGLPVMCLDRDTGVFDFITCEDGGIKVTGTLVEEGTPYHQRGNILASPGGTVTVLTATVPALTTRKLKHLWVTAINDGDFSLEAAGVEIAAGRIDVVQRNISFKFDPPRPISAGALLELKYIADSEPTVACPITAFLSGNDVI